RSLTAPTCAVMVPRSWRSADATCCRCAACRLHGGIAGPETHTGPVVRLDVCCERRRSVDDVDRRPTRAPTCVVVLLFLALPVGCVAPDRSAPGRVLCSRPERLSVLPPELEEASGLAASRRHAGVLWMHNDSGGEPEVFAVDSTGAVLGRVR